MLMVQLSRAAMGGVAAAVARALSTVRRPRPASRLAQAGDRMRLGLAIGAALLAGVAALYAAMGGRGEALALAQAYPAPLFAAAVATWLHNGLASVHVGAGNMRLPALCLMSSALLHGALCPLLVFGLGPVPALGLAGGRLSFVASTALCLRVAVRC
jgi:Na+-driven multidrug efflux pump